MVKEADADVTQMMRQVRAGDYQGKYDPANPEDKRLMVRFWNEPRINEQMSKDGFHWVDAEGHAISAQEADELVAKGETVSRERCTCVNDEGQPSTRLRREATESGHHVPGGRPIYVDTVMVSVTIPGDRDNIVVTEAWLSENPGDINAHNQRFPNHYRAFLEKKTTPVFGTPLIELTRTSPPILKESQVKEFEHFSCKTVEQLVAMSDANSRQFPGFPGIKQRAQQYLDKLEKEAPIHEMRSQLEKRDQEIAHLRQVVQELGDRVEKQAETKAKGKSKGRAEARP